jgi:C4-dicarboxylate-specific signal transduction histidine kinase
MAARTNPEQHSIALNPVIQEAMLFLKHELQRNDVDASFLPAPNLPNVIGDRVQLQQC